MNFFRNFRFRTLLEYLCGAVAQCGAIALFSWWLARTSNPDYCIGSMGMLAMMLAGPQVVFILHPGNEREKIHMASGYLGLSILLPLVVVFLVSMLAAFMRP